MAKPGPKTKWKQDPERIDIILRELEETGCYKTACELAQISVKSLERWMEADEILAMKCNYAKSKKIKRVAEKVEEKDPWKILKNIGKDRYQDEIKLTEETRHTLTLVDDDGLKDELKY